LETADSLAERGEFELPVPISQQTCMSGPRGLTKAGIARGSNAWSAYTLGNIQKRPPLVRVNDIATHVAAAIQ
jgi:hypothetical protein